MNAVECEALTRHFGKTRAVDHLDLQVPAGSVFALLGPNGAGKTTALKLLLNLIRPSSGRARVLGHETTRLRKDVFQKIGYVAEDLIQPDWMTLPQFISYYRSLYRDWDGELEARLRAAFGLPEDRAIRKFSRGMRMKAVLLSTLCFRPELLILDEPFSGLDPQVRDDLIAGILDMMNGRPSCSVIVSSHDIAEIERLADRVGILIDGRLCVSETMAELQGRFRRVEIVGPRMADYTAVHPAAKSDSWLEIETPSPTVLRFVHQRFDATAETELRGIFGGASAQFSPMSLREIFLVCAKAKSVQKETKGARA